MQLDLPTYPLHPGSKTGGTSREAAVVEKGRAPLLRNLCLMALQLKDMTADETAEAIGESILSVRPRISELHALKKIFKTDKRRKNKSKHSAVVWTTFLEALPQT